MFTVVIIQLHLALNKFYSQAAPCPTILDDFKRDALSAAVERREKELAVEKQEEKLPKGLYAPNSKKLPEINENGMIIFYLHIPKTGKFHCSTSVE